MLLQLEKNYTCNHKLLSEEQKCKPYRSIKIFLKPHQRKHYNYPFETSKSQEREKEKEKKKGLKEKTGFFT